MLPLEMMLAMGWPVPGLLEELNDKSPWSADFLSKQKASDIIRLTGNQMHCRVVGFFLAYCLAMTRGRVPA